MNRKLIKPSLLIITIVLTIGIWGLYCTSFAADGTDENPSNLVSNIAFEGTSEYEGSFDLSPAFDPNTHEYVLTYDDKSAWYTYVKVSLSDAGQGASITAKYSADWDPDWSEEVFPYDGTNDTRFMFSDLPMSMSGATKDLTFIISKDGIDQQYLIHIKQRKLLLNGITLKAGDKELLAVTTDDGLLQYHYNVITQEDLSNLTININSVALDWWGYTHIFSANGQTINCNEDTELNLAGNSRLTIDISKDGSDVTGKYVIDFYKSEEEQTAAENALKTAKETATALTETAAGMDLSTYPEANAKAVQDALDTLNEVLAKEDATADEINAAKTALETAVSEAEAAKEAAAKPDDDPDKDKPETTPQDTNAKAKAAAKKLTVKNLKVKFKKKKATITWKKTKGATGYQVQYRVKGAKKFTNLKKATKKNKVTSKKLKKGKKYQFRVRTYKTIAGKKVYGKWTKAKTVKCK